MSSTGQAVSSTDNVQLIIDALASFDKETGIDLSKNSFAANLEQSNSLEAILQQLQEREKAFKVYRDDNRRLINFFKPALKVIHGFSGILNEAVGQIPFPPAKILFAGIDVLLGAASEVTSSYDALLDLFEHLGSFVKRLDIYTNIPLTSIMTDNIVKIMVQLLSVLSLATKQITQGRLKKFAKKLLGESEIETVLQRLDRLTQDEARIGIAQTLGVLHGLVGNVKQIMEDRETSMNGIRQDMVTLHRELVERNKPKRDQLQRDVKEWLSPPDPSTNHVFVSKARLRGTAAWFFKGDALAKWKANGSLLWIHGKPGAGKSTLLSAIIQDIKDMRVAELATMAYYYFDFRDDRKQDCYGLLTSVVSQLSAESDSCCNVLSELYSDNNRGMQKPEMDALKKCTTDMLSLSGQGPIYIIIDALDECPNLSGTPSARDETLNLIEELVGLKLPNVHLCVASRPEIDIRMALKPLTSLDLSLHDEKGQKADIIAYIKSVVRSDRMMQRWREEDQNLVIDTLSRNAFGMFRWVVCQIDRLRRCFPASIRSVLKDLPESLDETYEQTLLRIDKEKREYARRLFKCLSVSIRPLRVEELAEIFAVDFDTTPAPSFNEDMRPPDAEEAVLSACSSLIAIVDTDCRKVVQFSHFSVLEFLGSARLAAADKPLSYYHILPERAHTVLVHAGLSVIRHLDDKSDRNAIGRLPLALYTAQYWVDHAQYDNVSSHIQEVLKPLFDPANPHFAAWVWLYDIDRNWIRPMTTVHPMQPEASPLYYASLCGFRGLVEHLVVTHSPDINNRGGYHTTALHAASVKGHSEVASLLLKSGADPNSRDYMGRVPLHRISQGEPFVMVESSLKIARLLVESGANINATDDNGRTPLHSVSRYGYVGIAQLLLDHHSDVNVSDKDRWTPMHLASDNGNLDISKLLVDNGATVDSRNNKQETPLDLASGKGYLEIVCFLFERGAAVSSRDDKGWTPLHKASFSGHVYVANFFLECGVDTDIQTGDEETSLYLASSSGELDVVRLLIEEGASTNISDKIGWNPLHIASKNGHVAVVQLLISSGTPINIRNWTQDTPLAVASREGNVEVGRILVERGADLNMVNNRSWAPIHFASRYGHLDMARLLLDHGVDASFQRDDLWSPLHLASANGHLEIAELLILRGAGINMFNNMQETPLYQAVWNGKAAIARLLIEHGANLRSADGSGLTLLHTASECGHLGVVKLLLRQGADVGMLNKAGRTAAELASENGKVEVAEFISEKTNANTRNKLSSTTSDTAGYDVEDDGKDDGNLSLHAAAEEGNIDVMKSLIERGDDVNAHNAGYETPLDRAAAKGNVNIVRLLIAQGAQVDARNKWGWTPLHLSSRYGHLEVSRVLLDHGANVNARHQDHWTPMHLSAASGYLEIVKLLLEHGADVNALNPEGRTPYQESLASGYKEIAVLLREHGASRESLAESVTPDQRRPSLSPTRRAALVRLVARVLHPGGFSLSAEWGVYPSLHTEHSLFGDDDVYIPKTVSFYKAESDIVPSLEPQTFHLIRQTVPFEEPVSKQWALPISTLYTPGIPLSVALVSGVMRSITKGYDDALVAGGSFLQGDADAFKDELGRGFGIYIMYQIGFAGKKS